MTDSLRWVVLLLIFLLAQFFLGERLLIREVAALHLYVLPVLLLPTTMPRWGLYLVAFICGHMVDAFTLPPGPSAIAAVTVIALREFWLPVVSPVSGLNQRDEFDFFRQDVTFYLVYLAPLLVIYEVAYYGILDLDLGWYTWLKIILSALYTLAACVVTLVLFLRRR